MSVRGSFSARIIAGVAIAGGVSSVAIPMSAVAQTNDESLDAFQQSNFSYCDAVLIAKLWSMSADQAKVQIGFKILHGAHNLAVQRVFDSRQQGHRCTWIDMGFGYDDAVKLADAWGLDTDQAKAKAERLGTTGHFDIVESLVSR